MEDISMSAAAISDGTNHEPNHHQQQQQQETNNPEPIEEPTETSSDHSNGSLSKESTKRSLHGGYTYWKRNIQDAHLLPSSAPQKLDDNNQQQHVGLSPSKSSLSLSAWNASGTWEERNVSSKVETQLTENLKEKELELILQKEEKIIIIESINCESCESSICFVRGKPRFGYEVSFLAFWRCPEGPAAGEIQVTNLTDHDVMPDVSVKVEKDKDAEFNQVVIGEMKKQLAKVFKTEIEQIGDALIEGSATAENDRKTSKIN